jgi:regulator of replication initiation timing
MFFFFFCFKIFLLFVATILIKRMEQASKEKSVELSQLRLRNAELHAVLEKLNAENRALSVQNASLQELLAAEAVQKEARQKVSQQCKHPNKKPARARDEGAVVPGQPDTAALQVFFNNCCLQGARFCVHSCPHMRYAHLVRCCGVSKDWQTAVMSALKMLKHVDFIVASASDDEIGCMATAGLDVVTTAFKRVGTALENLNLQYTEGLFETRSSVNTLENTMRTHCAYSSLKALTLRDVGIEEEACGSLALGLRNMTQLEVLDLGSNQMVAAGTTQLLDALNAR